MIAALSCAMLEFCVCYAAATSAKDVTRYTARRSQTLPPLRPCPPPAVDPAPMQVPPPNLITPRRPPRRPLVLEDPPAPLPDPLPSLAVTCPPQVKPWSILQRLRIPSHKWCQSFPSLLPATHHTQAGAAETRKRNAHGDNGDPTRPPRQTTRCPAPPAMVPALTCQWRPGLRRSICLCLVASNKSQKWFQWPLLVWGRIHQWQLLLQIMCQRPQHSASTQAPWQASVQAQDRLCLARVDAYARSPPASLFVLRWCWVSHLTH